MQPFSRTQERLLVGAYVLAVGIAGLALLSMPLRAFGAEIAMPVPAAVVYPGQAVDARPMEDRAFHVEPHQIPDYVLETGQLSGKVARRTLLPGKPIRLADLKVADIVEAGAAVTLVYRDAGLTITSLATVLQSAGEGDTVRARNLDSGIVVTGIVKGDGSVEIGG